MQPSYLIARCFEGRAVQASKDDYANFVIQQLIKVLPREPCLFVLNEVAEVPVMMAKHKCGCRVLQRLIEFSERRPEHIAPGLRLILEALIAEDERFQRPEHEVLDSIETFQETEQRLAKVKARLVNHPFANFVFSHFLEHTSFDHDVVHRVLLKDTFSLAESFHSSHVISNVLVSSETHHEVLKEVLVNALTGSEDKLRRFRRLQNLRS